MITEIFHKYLDEEITENDISILDKTKKLLNKDIKEVLILVDDLHIDNVNLDKVDIKTFVENILNCKVSVYEESLMLNYVKGIINKFNNKIVKEYFRKENKYVYFINTKNNKIALFEEKDNQYKYYCVLLSYTWTIFKLLGLSDERMIEYINGKEISELKLIKTYLVIQIEYKSIEEKVLELIKENFADLDKLIRIDYV